MTARHHEALANSLIRFNNHLREPDDLHLHLSAPSLPGRDAGAVQTVPIQHDPYRAQADHPEPRRGFDALGAKERVRNAVVAAVDERRLMVSQFYIESREHLLRASEEKYRNSIDHAPDPMYEIEVAHLEGAAHERGRSAYVPGGKRTYRLTRKIGRRSNSCRPSCASPWSIRSKAWCVTAPTKPSICRWGRISSM